MLSRAQNALIRTQRQAHRSCSKSRQIKIQPAVDLLLQTCRCAYGAYKGIRLSIIILLHIICVLIHSTFSISVRDFPRLSISRSCIMTRSCKFCLSTGFPFFLSHTLSCQPGRYLSLCSEAAIHKGKQRSNNEVFLENTFYYSA